MKKHLMSFAISILTLTASAQDSAYQLNCGHADLKISATKTVRVWADKGLLIYNSDGSINLNQSRLEITRSSVIGKNMNSADEEGVVRVIDISPFFGSGILVKVELPYNSKVKPKKIQLTDGSIKKMKTADFNCLIKSNSVDPI